MNPPKERSNTITGYSVAEKNLFGKVKENKAYYDLMSAVMICLGAGEETEEKDLLRLLDVLTDRKCLVYQAAYRSGIGGWCAFNCKTRK